MPYKQLSIEEREIIQLGLWGKLSVREIAKKINRSPSSVSREINRNRDSLDRRYYVPRPAHERALAKRKCRGREERLKNETVRHYVIERLQKRDSPEQIAGRIKFDCPGQSISHEAIYQYIYDQIHRDGYGYVRPGCFDLRPCLRRRKKRRTKHGRRRCQKMSVNKGVSIDLRPTIVNERGRVGDWESDSVESKDRKPGINTFVERKTGLVFITRLRDKSGAATTSAISNRLKHLPRRVKLTATFDNGPENQDWRSLERKTGLECYFAHPYRSCERGTNENTNGLIRDFFPKKTDFDQITDRQLKHVERNLNNRPRKRLNWQTPLEVFTKETKYANFSGNNESVALRG